MKFQETQKDEHSTNDSGIALPYKDSSITVGKYGPIVLTDWNMIEQLAHFARERIPERVVHAKGAGAFGYFEVTDDITDLTVSKVFDRVGKRTPIAVRFSQVAGNLGSADTVRDPRGIQYKLLGKLFILYVANLLLNYVKSVFQFSFNILYVYLLNSVVFILIKRFVILIRTFSYW